MSSEVNTIKEYLGTEFQQKIFWQILTESSFGEKIIDDLGVDYFDDLAFKRLLIIIKEYFVANKKVPNLQNKSIEHAIKLYHKKNDPTEEEVLNAHIERIRLWNERVLNKQLDFDGDIVQRETFTFIKQQEYRKLSEYIQASIVSGKIKEKSTIGNIEGKIKHINDIGDEENYGIDIFDNIDSALCKEFREPIATGIKAIDELMKGGLGKGEMGIILAPTGVGKTTILTKIANTAYDNDKNVLQIIFEDTPDQVRRKHFSLWSKVKLSDIDDNINLVKEKLAEYRKRREKTGGIHNELKIVRFNQENTTMSDIRNWILRYEKKFGVKFDIVILDYIDCVVGHKKAVDQNQIELDIIKAFEGMAAEFNIPCWTAIQTNRSGIDTDVVSTNQMGGNIKRAQKAHFLMSVAKTPDQKLGGLANISILKSRSGGDGHFFRDSIFDNDTMEIRVTTENGFVRSSVQLKDEGENDLEKLENKISKVNELHSEISQEISNKVEKPEVKQPNNNLDDILKGDVNDFDDDAKNHFNEMLKKRRQDQDVMKKDDKK